MAAGLTAFLNKSHLDQQLGQRLLAVDKTLRELAEIKQFCDGYTSQQLADLFDGAMTETDADDVKGALAHAAAAAATWDGANRAFIDRLTGLGV